MWSITQVVTSTHVIRIYNVVDMSTNVDDVSLLVKDYRYDISRSTKVRLRKQVIQDEKSKQRSENRIQNGFARRDNKP